MDEFHCSEIFAGEAFLELIEEGPDAFLPTVFPARRLDGTVMKRLGLDRSQEGFLS
jgi:hypothetical protein